MAVRAASVRREESMATTVRTAKSKGLIRSLNRRGTRTKKDLPVAVKHPAQDPTVCERCGAVFTRKTWRQGRKVDDALLATAAWAVCPACEQTTSGEYFGRVVVRGAYAVANRAAIRRRIANVASRARFTQPERRIVSTEGDGDVLEVLTTSQKLAHRITHELKKTFGGHASYKWSDSDGALFAIWQRDDVPAAKATARRK
jgi:NMD protein affecting ribosome stability and mRNA decay